MAWTDRMASSTNSIPSPPTITVIQMQRLDDNYHQNDQAKDEKEDNPLKPEVLLVPKDQIDNDGCSSSSWLDDVANNNHQHKIGSNNNRKQSPWLMEKSMPVAIQLKNVTIRHGSRFSLLHRHTHFECLNLTIPYGRVYAVIGAHRTGKTRLLETIGKIRRPAAGRVRHFRSLDGQKPSIGYMPQSGGFWPQLSPVENVYFHARYFGVEPIVMHQKLHRLMQMIGWDQRHRPAGRLHTMHQTMVGLSLASLHSPAVLLLDEPDFGPDLFLKENAWNQIRWLSRNENVTVVFATIVMEDCRFADEAAIVQRRQLYPCRLYPQTIKQIEHLHQSQRRTSGSAENDNHNELFTLDRDQKVARFAKHSYEAKFDDDDVDDTVDENDDHDPRLNQPRRGKRKSRPSIVATIDTETNATGPPTMLTMDIPRSKRNLRLRYRPSFHAKLFWTLWLTTKMFVQKRPLLTLSQLIVPTISVVLFHFFLGQNPYHLMVGVYNPDRPAVVSRHVLRLIDSYTIVLVDFDSLEQALQAVRDGQTWAAIEFPHNYTNSIVNQALQTNCEDTGDDEPEAETIPERLTSLNNHTMDRIVEREDDEIPKNFTRISLAGDDDDEDEDGEDLSSDIDVNRHGKVRLVNMVTIRLHVDNTNLLVSGFVKAKIYQALQLAQEEAEQNQFITKMPQPLEIVQPSIYAREDAPMSEFLLPGVIVAVIHFCLAVLPLPELIQIIRDPAFRVLKLARVDRWLVLLAWTIVKLILLTIQVIFLMLTLVYIVQISSLASGLDLVFTLIYLQGALALLFTVLLALITCGSLQNVLLFHGLNFLVMMSIGGILWPFECLPPVLRTVMMYGYPPSSIVESLRYAMNRGWSFERYLHHGPNNIIWLAINVPAAWIGIVFLLIVAVNAFRY